MDIPGILTVATTQSGSYATPWTTIGGDYHTDPEPVSKAFETGLEDLEVDVTTIVESWLTTPASNYGFGNLVCGLYQKH